MKVLARDLHKWEEELSWNGTWKNARQKKKKLNEDNSKYSTDYTAHPQNYLQWAYKRTVNVQNVAVLMEFWKMCFLFMSTSNFQSWVACRMLASFGVLCSWYWPAGTNCGKWTFPADVCGSFFFTVVRLRVDASSLEYLVMPPSTVPLGKTYSAPRKNVLKGCRCSGFQGKVADHTWLWS